MKKLSFHFPLSNIAIVLAMYLGFVQSANARPVSLEAAMLKAKHFLYPNVSESELQSRGILAQSFTLAYEAKTADRSASCFYVLNRPSSEGYIIISADDRLPDVLGYSDNGAFDADHVPENVKWWLSEYERQIEWMFSNDVATPLAETDYRDDWLEVTPLVKSQWDQGAPYNNKCPTINGTRALTGCVATAMAQIMNYYQWPMRGRGSHSYVWKGKTLSMDFSEITFDWDNMQNTYSFQNDSPEAQDAVATLMYACGISLDMNYGITESTAWIGNLPMCQYFDYIANYIHRGIVDISNAEVENLVYNELTNNRPVIYCGQSITAGHAFVCDGYSYDGLFHINWGWGGYYDGYFLLNLLNPGNGGYGFNTDQEIVYGIYPSQKVEIDGVWYHLVDFAEKEAIVALPDEGYYTGELIIPQTVTYENRTFTVTRMTDNIWDYSKDLTSLTIYAPIDEFGYWDSSKSPNLKTLKLFNVSHIGNWAFSNCTALETLEFGDGLESIGDYAFVGCNNLTTLQLGANLESIGIAAFGDCNALTALTIPDKVTTIGDYAFNGCNNLTTLQLGNSIESIGIAAFQNCNALTALTIPDKVTAIEDYAFNGCNNLTTLQLGNSIESIGIAAFQNCNTLTTLTIPSKVTAIGDYAFWGCNNLTTLQLGNSIESIGEAAFYGCNSLTTLQFGDRLESIGNWAFNDCTNLTTLKLGANLEFIGVESFWNCNSLTALTIPDKVTAIGDYAFNGCNSLKTLQLGNSIESIGIAAFQDCNALTTLTIPDKVKSIGDWAFNGCTNLEELNLENNLEFIGESAFRRCQSLTELTIPDNVEFIGDWAFFNCEAMTKLVMPNKVTSIGEYTFAYCANLTSLQLGANLETIGDRAFYVCNSLIDLIIPDKVAVIGEEAFCYSTMLKNITIPNSVKSIGVRAFYNEGTQYGKTIISRIEEPFDLLEGTFSEWAFAEDTLRIPIGTIEKYRAREVWKNFVNIIDSEPTDISSTYRDKFDATEQNRYILNGLRSTVPQRGINIIKMNDGTVKKVMIK